MLISVSELTNKFRILPNKVLHVGGHLGEEFYDMNQNGWGIEGTYWIESQKSLCDEMRTKFFGTNNIVINATVWSEDNLKMVFHENSNSQSSSLYKLGSHRLSYPQFVELSEREVITSTLDTLTQIPEGIDFINLDIQGAELEALKGATRILRSVKWIYTEVNRQHVYESCPLIYDLDAFLKKQGFKRIATRWSFGDDWGDALYSKKKYTFMRTMFIISESFTNITNRIRYSLHKLKVGD